MIFSHRMTPNPPLPKRHCFACNGTDLDEQMTIEAAMNQEVIATLAISCRTCGASRTESTLGNKGGAG